MFLLPVVKLSQMIDVYKITLKKPTQVAESPLKKEKKKRQERSEAVVVMSGLTVRGANPEQSAPPPPDLTVVRLLCPP